jgi:hypothetical protein
MADVKISGLPASTVPLAGTEVLPVVQGGVTKQVSVNNLTTGKPVSATQYTSTIATGTAPLVVASTTEVANLRSANATSADTANQVKSNATTGVLQVAGPADAATRVMTTPNANFTVARTDAGQTFTGVQVMTSPNIVTSINDTNGNELIGVTATGSAVNEITVANAATLNNPSLSATGGDTNIGINLTPKGTGKILINTTSGGSGGGKLSAAGQISAGVGTGVPGAYGQLGGYSGRLVADNTARTLIQGLGSAATFCLITYRESSSQRKSTDLLLVMRDDWAGAMVFSVVSTLNASNAMPSRTYSADNPNEAIKVAINLSSDELFVNVTFIGVCEISGAMSVGA